jgi:hypothetical protein
MADAELWKRRTELFQAKVRRTERLGRLAAVFDGYGLSLHEAGAVSVLVSWTDFDPLADALETGGRATPYHQMGRFEACEDGSFFMQAYDWNSEVSGEVTVPAEQISPLVRLLRSLPFPPFVYFHTTDGEHRRDFTLVIVHRGELDRHGNQWPHETPLVELYEWYRPDAHHAATRFVATVGLVELLDRPSDEPLRVSTTSGPLVVQPGDLAACMPQLRRAVRSQWAGHGRA